ncbi:MAG TPA: hypothetical protein VEX62_07300 [Candidatus Limnocylindrales bacterium]|nr:hypothetical protein [Candidatus Limnocylindrales bacterium]
MTGQLLDPLPVLAITIIFAIIALIGYEVGFRIGRWWQHRTPGEQEGPTGTLVGAILALMAFLLAVTMSMASDRFDTRRGLVLQESNAIGTTYLRAGYLPAPANLEMRVLLREYVPLRIAPPTAAQLAQQIARSEELLQEMWVIAEEVARTNGNDVNALFIESLNEVIDLHESRVVAGVYARVPETVILLLAIGAILSLVMLGYSAGITERRSVLSAVVLVIALGAVLTLVIDLDRPRDGFITVSQQPLLDLQRNISDD